MTARARIEALLREWPIGVPTAAPEQWLAAVDKVTALVEREIAAAVAEERVCVLMEAMHALDKKRATQEARSRRRDFGLRAMVLAISDMHEAARRAAYPGTRGKSVLPAPPNQSDTETHCGACGQPWRRHANGRCP